MTLSPNWKMKTFTTLLTKNWLYYQFLSLLIHSSIFCWYKKILSYPQKLFGLEGQGGYKVAYIEHFIWLTA